MLDTALAVGDFDVGDPQHHGTPEERAPRSSPAPAAATPRGGHVLEQHRASTSACAAGAAGTGSRRTHPKPEVFAVLIGAIVAVCVMLLILAFLAPRLSRDPSAGASGLRPRAAARLKAPGPLGRLFSKPFRSG